MPPRLHHLAALTSLTALAFAAFGLPGCTGERSCISWNAGRGACPTAEAALAMMTPNCDQAEVESVDSEGTFEEDVCCYDVTKNDAAFYVCASPVPPSTGSGASCLTCAQWLNDPSATVADVCSSSLDTYDALADCVCINGCNAECFSTACSGTPGPQTCSACVESVCAPALNDCAGDF
jgi:hypothetical protein